MNSAILQSYSWDGPKLLDGGAIRGVVDLEGGAIRGVVAAWWRRGVLDEFWRNSEYSRKENKYLVFVDFREFLTVLKFLVSPQMGCKNPPRLLTGSIRKLESAWHFRSVATNIEQILCSFQSFSKYDVHSSWIYLEGVMQLRHYV